MSPNKSKKLKSDQLWGGYTREVPKDGFPCSSRNWTASFVEPQRPKFMLQFEDYCRFRSTMQLQLLINNRQTEVFGADDKMFASLILVEQQYQYSSGTASFQAFESNRPTGNFKFQNNLTQSGSTATLRKRSVPKKKIKKYEGKPKKPLTSFMLFLKDYRKTIESKPSSEKLLPNELNRQAGKQWHMLPDNIKMKYHQEANKAFQIWKVENFPEETKKKEATNTQPSNAANSRAFAGHVPDTSVKMVNKDCTLSSASSPGYSSSDDASGSESS